MDGVLIVNKPAGMTSHDVVARVRRILNEKSAGHLGTLDPSATGVLPLVVGRFTRLATFYSEAEKRYEGVIHFGVATDTYDAEGEPLGSPQKASFDLEQLRDAAAKFVGKIQQAPPPFSAKKVAGVPAYKLARKKQDVELKSKEVEIKELEILGFDGDRARFKAWVSSGTYMRSLAHDLGRVLGCGAHLGELTRTAVREFTLSDARKLEELEAACRSDGVNLVSDKKYYVNKDAKPVNRALQSLFLHPRLILPEFPAVTAPPEALTKIRHGAAVNLPFYGATSPVRANSTFYVRVFENQERLIAIARRIAGTLFHPKIVLM